MRAVRKTNRFGFGKLEKFEIAKLELKPGDTVVLRTDMVLDPDQCRALYAVAKEQFPDNKVVMLTAGMSLAVLSDKSRRPQ